MSAYVDSDLISIIMPTMGRRDSAEIAIEMAYATKGENEVEFVCVVDRDAETVLMLAQHLTLMNVQHKILFHPEAQGLARSWNRGLRCADGGILVFYADDLRPRQGWLDEALRILREELDGYGLIGFNDTHRPGKLEATHYLVDRQFLLNHLNGCMGFEHYDFCCNDSEACRRARLVGRYRHARDAVVERLLVDDETKKAHFDRAGANRDLKLLRQREAARFPDDFEKAILK